MSVIRVGLDVSLSSTGMAIIEGKNIVLIFKPQNKKQQRIHWQQELNGYRFSIRPFQCLKIMAPSKPGISKKQKKKIQSQKISHVVDAILSELQRYDQKTTTVFIEDYAYGMTNSSSLSVLHELGGALKYVLLQQKFQFEGVSPSSAKKQFAGNGRASKHDMLVALQTHFALPLFAVFGKTPAPNVPNPIQDIVDAFALAWIH